MTPIRVLVAEPDHESAQAIQQTLAQAGMQIVHVSDSRSVFNAVCREEFDIILLSLHLGDEHGFRTCYRLRKEKKFNPIILLSRRSEESDLISGIELGADDYLYVPFHPAELLARIYALLRRSGHHRPVASKRQPIRFGDVSIDLDTVRVTRFNQLIDITPTEFRLLRYLWEHRNLTCNRDVLMAHLRGSQGKEISQRTIDVHMRRLRQKLEADPANPRWLVTVHGLGYKFVE